ncbi:hypothetical protein N7462_011185 [Penicillium macrosclerotiorum]|uniref:uncharacterized protein n=1 Tax=Penicillium macrosclerotiorum TaxID=303699 RepID=UPI002546D4C7|nr:uncharacterized protein N7462_011185 [Penicillium macrosclerotiorum]KAJ5666776.1 hypothetical protein N7462_011185 [Penicillium macrosclerotiorum]
MPDMPAVFQMSASPPKLDLASANSQLFQVPTSASASSSLYSLSVSRKRPRRDTEKLSTKFGPASNLPASPLFQPDYQKTPTHDEVYSSTELDYRPNRYRQSFLPPSLDASVQSIGPDSEGTSRKRSRRDSVLASPTAAEDASPNTRRVGWGRTVINAVGKVLDLCWSGAFRGFYAGGGQGYDMQAGSPPQITPSWQPGPSATEKDRIFQTPIPGQYPEEEIERNWVVIPNDPADPFVGSHSPSTPSSKPRRIHQASSPRRRPAMMPRLAKRTNNPSMRPSTPTRSSALPSPRAREGPASADMQRYAAQMRRKEREEDASIKRLNRQLQAMIREGKEALGTTVDVDDLDMDFD